MFPIITTPTPKYFGVLFLYQKSYEKKKHIVREPGQRPFRSESSVMLGPTTFPKIIFEN